LKYKKCFTQQDAMDCGPVCLQNIASYYGRFISLAKLRDLSFLNREGVSKSASAPWG